MLKMKSLRESLLDDDLVGKTDEMIKDEIKAFLKANYKGSIKISRKPNTDNKYEVSSTTNIEVKNKNITSLTNGTFVWSEVTGNFNCLDCNSLKLLEGSNATKTGGSILQNVSQETLKQISVCIPPNEIVKKYNESINDIFRKMQNVIEENRELTSLRDFLLPMLMNGQISIKRGQKSAN